MSPYNFQSSFSTDTQEDDGFTFRRARPREEENFDSLTTQGIKRHAVDDFDDDFKEFQRSTSSAKRVHYTERTSTRQSEASLASEASYKVTDELPAGLSANKLYVALPPELPERERLRQILIWSAQTNIEKPSFSNQTYKSRDEQNAKETAYLIKKEIVRKLTDKAIEVSLLAYPQKQNSTPMFARKKPNIQNVKNQDKFKRLIDMMQTLKKEEDKWNKESDELFQKHAEIMDQAVNASTISTEDLLNGLDETQRQFYNSFISKNPRNGLKKFVRNLDPKITSMKTSFNALEQMEKKAKKKVDIEEEKLATMQEIEDNRDAEDALHFVSAFSSV